MVWVKFAVGVATGTAIHTGWRGDNIYEVVGWSALTGGISTLLSSGRFWGTAWGGVRAAGPPLWILAKDVAFVVRGTAGLIAQTRTAQVVAKSGGALGAGYVLGAAVGTGVIYVAEEKGIVYEGATTDVARFYTGGGEYWGDYDWKGTPTTDDPGRPGYFNVPGNLGIIAEHVKHGHYFGH
jgi:hypothetical protein